VTITIDKNGQTDQLKIDQPNNDFWFLRAGLKDIEIELSPLIAWRLCDLAGKCGFAILTITDE
jgi:hypothetical protein